MRRKIALLFVCILIAGISYSQEAGFINGLKNRFDFSGRRTGETQYFVMQSELISYTLHGSRLGRDIFKLRIKYTPLNSETSEADITCEKFTIKFGDSSEVEIPAMKNWSYKFIKNPTASQNGVEVFGVPHSKFENLKDENNKLIPPDKAYHVYNAFIDFHSFCDVFCENHETGAGVKDLHFIGDRIKHAAANSEAPVNLGSNVDEGSTFKNGVITLEFNGISIADSKSCALLEYDSGESSFKMNMTPMPGIKININGTSHYFGSIYRNLNNNWMQKATLHEFVTSETLMPFDPKNITGIAERIILVENVAKQ